MIEISSTDERTVRKTFQEGVRQVNYTTHQTHHAGKAIVSSAVAGGINLNPIFFATLTAFGLVVKGVARLKKYDKIAERANFARVEVLDAIPFHLRGEAFVEKEYLDRLKLVDDFVNDHCMEIPEKIQ